MCVHACDTYTHHYAIRHNLLGTCNAQVFSEVCGIFTASAHPSEPTYAPPPSHEAFSLQDNDSGTELCHWIMISCG